MSAPADDLPTAEDAGLLARLLDRSVRCDALDVPTRTRAERLTAAGLLTRFRETPFMPFAPQRFGLTIAGWRALNAARVAGVVPRELAAWEIDLMIAESLLDWAADIVPHREGFRADVRTGTRRLAARRPNPGDAARRERWSPSWSLEDGRLALQRAIEDGRVVEATLRRGDGDWIYDLTLDQGGRATAAGTTPPAALSLALATLGARDGAAGAATASITGTFEETR